MTPEQKLARDRAIDIADMFELPFEVWERLRCEFLDYGDAIAQLEREAIAAFLRSHGLEQIAQAIERQEHSHRRQ